jgi:hypothetical protein
MQKERRCLSRETHDSQAKLITKQATAKNLLEHILHDFLHVGRGDALAQPAALHLGGGHGPDLEVVGAHEDVGDALAHHAHDPLVEILGGGLGPGVGHSRIHQPVNAVQLVLQGKGADVVLERIRHPSVEDPDVEKQNFVLKINQIA